MWNSSLVVRLVLGIERDHVVVVERVAGDACLPFYYYLMNEELIATMDELDGVMEESGAEDPLVHHLMVDDYYYGCLVLPGKMSQL